MLFLSRDSDIYIPLPLHDKLYLGLPPLDFALNFLVQSPFFSFLAMLTDMIKYPSLVKKREYIFKVYLSYFICPKFIKNLNF